MARAAIKGKIDRPAEQHSRNHSVRAFSDQQRSAFARAGEHALNFRGGVSKGGISGKNDSVTVELRGAREGNQ